MFTVYIMLTYVLYEFLYVCFLIYVSIKNMLFYFYFSKLFPPLNITDVSTISKQTFTVFIFFISTLFLRNYVLSVSFVDVSKYYNTHNPQRLTQSFVLVIKPGEFSCPFSSIGRLKSISDCDHHSAPRGTPHAFRPPCFLFYLLSAHSAS